MRHIFTALLCGALLVPTSIARAQDEAPKPPAAAPDPKSDPKKEVINVGELRLDGKITALLGEGIWQMEAISWTSPRGVSTDFEEARTKDVTVSPDTYLHPRGELVKVAMREVKIGARVGIIGKNGPGGALIAREIILLEGYGARKTVGSVATSAAASALVKLSRDARDAGQLPKALQIIDRAVATARGLNDLGGEGLATQDKALLHNDMDQPKEALQAFNRVQAIGRQMGNSLLLSLGLSGSAGMLRASGQNDKALALYKEADTVSASSVPSIHLSILGNLAQTYLLVGQLSNGVATLNRVHPLEDASGKEADGGETLLLVAALQATERPTQARQTLKDVQGRIDRARDEKAKAGLLGNAGLVRWRLDEKDAARANFTQAAQIFETAGAPVEAKRWAGMAAALEAAGEEWQKFFVAASGFKKPEPKEGEDETPGEGAPV